MSSHNINIGPSFGGLLTVAFIVLKLCGVIGWSWLWVLSPIWIPVGIGLAVILSWVIIALIVLAISKIGGF